MLTSVTGNLCIYLRSSERNLKKKSEFKPLIISMEVFRKFTCLLAVLWLMFGSIYIFKANKFSLWTGFLEKCIVLSLPPLVFSFKPE